MSQSITFHCKISNRQNVEESCTIPKIYGVGKVKLQTKWSDRLEKHKFRQQMLKK